VTVYPPALAYLCLGFLIFECAEPSPKSQSYVSVDPFIVELSVKMTSSPSQALSILKSATGFSETVTQSGIASNLIWITGDD